eukprot:774823-Pyramimonas_sp.AAC.2
MKECVREGKVACCVLGMYVPGDDKDVVRHMTQGVCQQVIKGRRDGMYLNRCSSTQPLPLPLQNRNVFRGLPEHFEAFWLYTTAERPK